MIDLLIIAQRKIYIKQIFIHSFKCKSLKIKSIFVFFYKFEIDGFVLLLPTDHFRIKMF